MIIISAINEKFKTYFLQPPFLKSEKFLCCSFNWMLAFTQEPESWPIRYFTFNAVTIIDYGICPVLNLKGGKSIAIINSGYIIYRATREVGKKRKPLLRLRFVFVTERNRKLKHFTLLFMEFVSNKKYVYKK